MNHLKRKLQEIIDNIDDSICATSATPGTSAAGASPSRTEGQQGNSQTETISFATRAADNFRRAFPALSRPARGQIKKRQQSTQKILFVRNTFTGTFCCLADNETVTPNSKELYTLSWHGLGKKRHTFESKDGDHKHLQNELEKLFPRLKAANGKFQLYRTLGGGSGRRSLHKIPMGPQGYTINWLRENIAIGSACIYVVPLVALPQESDQCEPASSTQMPTVTCDNCHEEVKLNIFEDHKCKDSDDDLLASSFETDNLDSFAGPPNSPPVVQVPESEVDDLPAPHTTNTLKTPGMESKTSDMLKLKEIFPTETEAALEEALRFSINVEDAIETLVKKTADGDGNLGPTPVSIDVDDDWEPPPMLQDQNPSKKTEGLSADHILKIFKEGVVKSMGPTMAITFNRSKNAFRELCRIYKNSSVKLQRPPVVYFVSKDGEDEDYEEEAADVGGPLKEFLSIAIETVLTSNEPQIFEGREDHKVPVHSQQLVLNGYFRMVGQVMGHAIIHGEVWITGLAKPVKEFLSTGCAESASKVVCLDDVPDFDVWQVLKHMAEVNESEIGSLNSDEKVINLMGESGCSAAILTIHNVAQIAYEIMVYHVVHKRLRELEEIRKGFDVLELNSLLRDHPKVVSLVFPTVNEAVIDVDVLQKRTIIDPTATDSDRDNIAYKFLLDYLETVGKRKEGVGIKSVLAFMTGSTLMPKEINIRFLPDSNSHTLPDPDTCTNTVKIPTCHTSYEQFESAFDATVRIQGKGYGRA